MDCSNSISTQNQHYDFLKLAYDRTSSLCQKVTNLALSILGSRNFWSSVFFGTLATFISWYTFADASESDRSFYISLIINTIFSSIYIAALFTRELKKTFNQAQDLLHDLKEGEICKPFYSNSAWKHIVDDDFGHTFEAQVQRKKMLGRFPGFRDETDCMIGTLIVLSGRMQGFKAYCESTTKFYKKYYSTHNFDDLLSKGYEFSWRLPLFVEHKFGDLNTISQNVRQELDDLLLKSAEELHQQLIVLLYGAPTTLLPALEEDGLSDDEPNFS